MSSATLPLLEAARAGDNAACERLLEEERVVCIPGSAFGACGEGHIRVAYTCGMDALDTAASRIARFCKGVSAGK